MVTVESSVDIQRSVETVFAFVVDKRNSPQWQGVVKEARVTPDGPPTVGAKVTEVMSFLGVRLQTTGEITAMEPNRSISIKATGGPSTAQETWRFEAVGSGTRLSATLQAETGGLFKVAEPLLANQLKKQVEADFQRLKALLETQPG